MKRFAVKLIALLVVVICTLSAYCIPTSAIDIVFNYNNIMRTPITNRVGRSVAMYAQEMGTSWHDSTLKLQSGCVGGPTDEYLTSFEVRVNSFYFDTDLKRNNTDSVDYEGPTDVGNLQYTSTHTGAATAQGYTEHVSVNKTNTADKWLINYLHDWVYDRGGWQPYGS